MHFKPLSHLARYTFAKGVAHAYSPGAVVAGQQGLGTLHTYPVSKLSKASHAHNAFHGTGAGAGAKSGHASTSGTSDGSLTQYFAAFNHAQQTGDDTEYKKQQGARKIGWKNEKNANTKSAARHDLVKPADILRQSVRIPIARAYSENATHDIRSKEESATEAQANSKIDEALATEIKPVQDTQVVEEASDQDSQQISSPKDSQDSQVIEPFEISRPSSTVATSPIYDSSVVRSDEIVELGSQARYADVAYRFQSMAQDGLIPNIHAYNYIIRSAIALRPGYQAYPRALEVFNDMTSKGVEANEETYQVLISFLANESLTAHRAQKEIQQHKLRYGHGEASFMLPSLQHKEELFIGDLSIKLAQKLFSIAQRSITDFRLSDSDCSLLLQAYNESNDPSNVIALTNHLHATRSLLSPEFYVSAISASAQTQDLSDAKFFYQQYRNTAIEKGTSSDLDNKAYIALIKAYYACGMEEEGLNFYGKIVQSFENMEGKDVLIQELTDAFVADGLVEYYVETGNLHQALQSLKTHSTSEITRARAINKILIAAADGDQSEIVVDTLSMTTDANISTEAFIAITAMRLRAGEVAIAKAFWARGQRAADVSFATMYGLSLLRTEGTEQALSETMMMFRQIRNDSPAVGRQQGTAVKLDESIQLIGQTLARADVLYSSQAAVLLFRLMIENGGLVPFITQAAIARIGPECVRELSAQDIALALHVQAYMLPASTSATDDTASAARFSHLLQTILDKRIGMDPATVHAVDNAIPRLDGTRPDLERRWTEWRNPALTAKVFSPAQDSSSATQSYDPYAHTIDHRASRVISESLDSTSGRPEVHLAEAMARLKNVRRMGRHLQYSAYAKLITAAGKVKQGALMHEIFAMAQTDVPFNAAISAVRSGWISIYDSMIAGCLSVGERDLAAKFHDQLLAMGAVPSANTFGIYITTLSDTFDEATEAVKIFQRAMSEGVTPTVFLFNAVIGKLGKARRIDDCLQYFGQMQNLGIRPSSVTYGTLVNALCRTSEESFAVEMFDEMEAAPNYRPRPAPYNSIIQYFLNTKRDRAKVLQYYGRMRSRNIKPTSHTYKLLIEAYATLEPINLTAAEAMLEDMKINGVAPEAVHYGSLIHAKGCVLSDMPGARAIFDSVLANPTIRATDNLYQNLLEAMVANHQVADTQLVLDDMYGRGITMTPYIANTLIHGWAGAGEIQKAKSIYDSLGREKREPSTYEAMTRAFITAEDRDGANGIVREMLSKGYPTAVSDKVLGLVGGI